MARRAIFRTAAALAAAWMLLAGPAAWSQAQKGNLKPGIETCKQTFGDADKDGKTIDSVLDNLEGLVAKGKLTAAEPKPDAQADRQNAPRDDKAAKQTIAMVKAGPPALPNRMVIAQARQARQWIKSYIRQGQAELEKAKRAKDPKVARVHLKAALLQADKVRNITRRLATALTPDSGGGAQRTPGARKNIHLNTDTPLMRRLKHMVKTSQRSVKTSQRSGVSSGAAPSDVYEAWEGVPAKGFLSTQGTGFFQGRFEQKKGRIKLESGRTVDVRPLIQALRKVAPQAARKPLFREVPSPTGGRPELRLSPEALKAVHNPATRKKMVKVGGVDLNVTFDLLSFAGVSDLRGGGPAKVIESPVLVSLGELYRRLKPYAGSPARWRELPDELRYPAGLERLHGYVLDPRTKDVFLVGTPARGPETRIDVDSLILGLRSVWAKGDTPSVSLDPMPGNAGGPQYSRVYNVPSDSVAAKIMLDADYAMKRIMAGHLKVNQPGYASYADILRRERPSGGIGNRFWLHPTPLGWNDVHQSANGRTVLVETRVQLLTEAQKRIAAGVAATRAEKYSGQVYGPAKRAADNFTRFYDRFERAPEIRPKGTFVLLHGLLDVVTLANFWRRARFEHTVLQNFSRLPVRRLSVPAHYSGITVSLYEEVRRTRQMVQTIIHTLSGGVKMRIRSSGRSVETYQDMVTNTLERAVDSFQPQRGFAQPVSLTFALPRAGGEEGTRTGQLFELGLANLRRGKYKVARGKFTELTRIDPFLTDAWANLATAESLLGNHKAAIAAINKALLQEPADIGLRQNAIMVLSRADKVMDLAIVDPALRRDASGEYALAGFLAWAREDNRLVEKFAEKALRLWEDNADGYFLRAQVRKPMSRGWTRDIDRAIRLYRRQLKENDRGRTRLALTLAWRAQAQRIDLGRRTDDRLLNNPGALRHLMLVADRAARDAAEAAQLSPRLGLAPSVEIELLTWRVGIFQAIGRPWDMSEILRRADRLARKFPDFAPGHRVRAYALGTAGKVPAAVEAISRAIELNPKLHGALPERAGMRAMLRDCAGARADIGRAHELGLDVAPEIESFVKQCR